MGSCATEMGIEDQSKNCTVRGAHGGSDDSSADLADRRVLDGSAGKGDTDRLDHVIHTPIGERPIGRSSVREQPELIPGDAVADVERLVKIGFDAEDLRPPRLGRIEFGRRIDDRAKALQGERHSGIQPTGSDIASWVPARPQLGWTTTMPAALAAATSSLS